MISFPFLSLGIYSAVYSRSQKQCFPLVMKSFLHAHEFCITGHVPFAFYYSVIYLGWELKIGLNVWY